MPRRTPRERAAEIRFSEPAFVKLSTLPKERADRIRLQNEAMIRARQGDDSMAIELGLFSDPEAAVPEGTGGFVHVRCDDLVQESLELPVG